MGDLAELFREPLVLEALLAVVLFAAALLVFRKMRLVAAELERRKALHEYVQGLDEFLRGDHRDAIRTLEKVLERDPESVEARIALGDCYREVGDAAEAKKHHHHVHRVFGHELARNFLSLGRDELALGNYDLAVEAFGKALALSPHESGALEGLARANAEGGNPVAAAEHLRRLYPRGPGAEMGKAARREAARRFREAGSARLDDGDAEGAIRFFAEALAFLPESLPARLALVRAAQRLRDPARARALVEEHLAALRELAYEGEVLFEPAAAGTPAAAPPPPGAEAPASLLPAKAEPSIGALVAAVEARTARFSCSACGTLLRDHAAQCPACGSVGTVEALEALAALHTMPIGDFRGAVDEVEGNAAFVQALARRASTGDAEALRRLLEHGAGSLYEVFAALPGIEARRYLGAALAALGPAALRELRECHAARPDADFTAAFLLALDDGADEPLRVLGAAHDRAVAGVMADPRLAPEVRDRAAVRLEGRGIAALVPVVEAVAASGDFGGVERAARLVRGWGGDAAALLDRRYLQATLLGRFFGAGNGRRRAAADILARAGVPGAADALGRAAAREKDAALRAHYAAARARAQEGTP